MWVAIGSCVSVAIRTRNSDLHHSHETVDVLWRAPAAEAQGGRLNDESLHTLSPTPYELLSLLIHTAAFGILLSFVCSDPALGQLRVVIMDAYDV